ncbi:MAG: hypothetical protein LT071_09715, partial [Nocardioides sp.]|nr:hypothetical protein [Nocardioides sp.]
MIEHVARSHTPCPTNGCAVYRAGHLIHVIHARRIGQTPWGWRDGVVVEIEGQEFVLAYLEQDADPIVAWHHRPWLFAGLTAGEPVRVHEEHGVVGTASGWFSAVITGGIGPVATPAEPGLWAPE